MYAGWVVLVVHDTEAVRSQPFGMNVSNREEDAEREREVPHPRGSM